MNAGHAERGQICSGGRGIPQSARSIIIAVCHCRESLRSEAAVLCTMAKLNAVSVAQTASLVLEGFDGNYRCLVTAGMRCGARRRCCARWPSWTRTPLRWRSRRRRRSRASRSAWWWRRAWRSCCRWQVGICAVSTQILQPVKQGRVRRGLVQLLAGAVRTCARRLVFVPVTTGSESSPHVATVRVVSGHLQGHR